ncbi:MAG: hypothetical protein HQM10_12200 [Candidatus Riflebacteria bacterium]|nr:hypothetical protein [Candidatus Riflebacteria bacterium]
MKTARACNLLLVLLVLLFSRASYAVQYSRSIDYETSQTRAMGGVSIALANDRQVLFSNPAGLGPINDKEYSIVQLESEINDNWQRMSTKVGELSDKETPWERAKNNNILNQIVGEHGRIALSNLSYYLGAENFGAAFLYQGITDFEVVNPVTPKVRASGSIDSVLTGSVARPVNRPERLFNSDASGWWGAAMKVLSRRTFDETYYARDFAGLSESDMRKNERGGTTLDFDFGALWLLKAPWRTNFGFVVKNIFENEIDPGIGKLRREWGFGASINPLDGSAARYKKLTLAADYWHLQEKSDWFSRLRAGAEAWVRPWLALRCGIRGGYFSGGIGADFKTVRIDLSTYGEELGLRAGDKEDRRYTLALGIEF